MADVVQHKLQLEFLRQVHRRALARLAALLETQREYAEAIRHLQRLLQEEPTDEESCRGLMRLMAVMGDRAGALRVYRDHAATLRRELGIEPSGDTRRAHQVLLRNEAATDERAPASADARADVGPPLVGRDREWQALLAAWRGAAAGKPGFALLTGEAGIGKSRLSEELMGWARSQGASVAATRSYATEGQLSLAPVSDWLRTDVLRRGLLRLAPMWLTEVARILPELRTERPELPPPAAITEYGQRQRFFEALARSVLAAPQPLLLVIDDLRDDVA